MRILVIAIVLGAGSASAKLVVRPPFQRECLAPAAWTEITRCANRTEPGSVVVEWAKDLRVLHTPNAGAFLFVERDKVWRSVYSLGDANYELLTVARPEAGRPNMRIEMSHFVDLPGERLPVWLRERVVVICDPALACHTHVTACTVMRGGRAIEAYRATFELAADGTPTVVGDRRMTGVHCRHR